MKQIIFFDGTKIGLIPPIYNHYFEMNDQNWQNKKTVGLIPLLEWFY